VSLSFRKFLLFRLLFISIHDYSLNHTYIIFFFVESDTLDVKEHPSNEQKPTVERTEAVKNWIVKGQ
jgi:hypothetical protein